MREFRINRRILGRVIAAVVVIAGVVIVFANQKTVRSLPLSTVITTGPQEDMRQFDDVIARGEMEDFRSKILTTHRNVANAFLVDATNEKDAIRASEGVLFGSKSPDTAVPVNTPTAKRGSYWLVAYLGLGPSYPTAFVVEKVSVKGSRVSLTYSKPTARTATADIHHYYYWVPLGELRPGVYRVELYDAGLKDVTLRRRVQVRE